MTSPAIELQMIDLATLCGDGQHSGLRCPQCRDHTTDAAMSMFVDRGCIRAVCHRATCGFKFNNGLAAKQDYVESLRPSRVNPYTGALTALDVADLTWLSSRFHTASPQVFASMRKSDGRYFIPVVAPDGYTQRGWISRRPWPQSPLYVEGDKSPKSLTYMDNDEPVQSWVRSRHGRWNDTTNVVLVEDQISAYRVSSDTQWAACALLGTGLNQEKVAEIQRHSRHVLIALDSDATGQAFAHARKWGQAFESCRVFILKQDIKDLDYEALTILLPEPPAKQRA